MNTRDLDYFQALVKYGKYTRVAEQFAVSQPSVTQAIKRLEKEFDVQLVQQDRAHQQTIITRAGLLLSKNAEQVQRDLELARREIESTKNDQMRVGVPPIIGTLYFPQVAGALLSAGLLQQADIRESGSDELLTDLRTAEIDLAVLGSIRPIKTESIKATHLGSRPFVIIVSQDHPLANSESVSFTELGNEKFINMTGRYVHPRAFKAYCDYADIHPEIVYDTPDYSWVKGLVAQNLGIALIVQDAVNQYDNVKVLEITDPVPVSFNVSVATRNNYVLSESEQQFMGIVQNMIVQK